MTYILIINIILSCIMLARNLKSKQALTYSTLLIAIDMCIFSVILSIARHSEYYPVKGLLHAWDQRMYFWLSGIKTYYYQNHMIFTLGVCLYLCSMILISITLLQKGNKNKNYWKMIFLVLPIICFGILYSPQMKRRIFILMYTSSKAAGLVSFLSILESCLNIYIIALLILPIMIVLGQFKKSRIQFTRKQNYSILLSLSFLNFAFALFLQAFTIPLFDSLLEVNFNHVSQEQFTFLPMLLIISANIMMFLSLKNNVIEPMNFISRIIFNARIKMTARDFRGYFHTYKNTFFVVKILAEGASAECVLDSTKETLDKIVVHSENALDDMNEILNFFQTVRPVPRIHHLENTIDSVMNKFDESDRDRIYCTVNDEEQARVFIDKHMFADALYNIIHNGLDAVKDEDEPLVQVDLVCENDYAIITVTDNGIGMDKQTRRNVFKPFRSTKSDFSWGIGVNYAYRVIKANKGFIFCESEEGSGTEFQIVFPIVRRKDGKN